MAFHSSSIELSSETKKGFGRWLIFALLVVAAAFFLPWQLGGKPLG